MAGYFVGLRNLISSIIYRPLDWLFRYFLGIEVGRRNIENDNLLRVQIKTMNNDTVMAEMNVKVNFSSYSLKMLNQFESRGSHTNITKTRD